MLENSISLPDSSDSGLNTKATPTEIRNFTYGDLRQFHLKQLKDDGKSKQVIDNTNTTLNKWLQFATWLNRNRDASDPGLSASDHDFVGDELLIDFLLCLREYITEYKTPTPQRKSDKVGYEPQTIYDRTRYIRQVQKSWLVMVKSNGLPEDFGGAVRLLCAAKKQTITGTAVLCHIPRRILRRWVSAESPPSYGSLKHITSLEEHFGIQMGALKARLPNILRGMVTKKALSNRTPWRKHQGILSKKVYGLKQLYSLRQRTEGIPKDSIKPIPNQLEVEWQNLYRFYTDGAWVVTQGLKRSDKSSGWKTNKETKRNKRSESCFLSINYFLGYLCLPEQPTDPALHGVEFDTDNEGHIGVRGLDPHLMGKGIDPETVSLAFLTDTDLIYDYINFLKGRTYGNIYTETARSFLSLAAQLTHPDYGYLWQLPHFSSKLPQSDISKLSSSDISFNELLRKSGEEAARGRKNKSRYSKKKRKETDDEKQERRKQVWQEYCTKAHTIINDLTRSIAKDVNLGFQKSNDSIDIIKPLVHARQHPITILLEMVEKLRHDIRNTKDQGKKAKLFRTMLLIEIAASNPMRINNLATMKYKEGCEGKKDDKCNLYQKKIDSSWHLKYEVWELKNGAQRGRYDLPIHQSVWKDIEAYLTIHRKELVGADDCDYVFRHSLEYFNKLSSADQKKIKAKPMNAESLSDDIFVYSQMLDDDCLGFSAQAIRHFVATEWLKNHPGAYPVAGAILHDSEEMARDTYNWCEPKDMAVFWNNHLGEVLDQFKEDDLL